MKPSATKTLPALTLGLSMLAEPASAANPSGLPWPSGAKSNLSALATARGRPLDVHGEHVNGGSSGQNFPGMVSAVQGWVSQFIINETIPVDLLRIVLLPQANAQQWDACVAGNFDTYWRQMGTALKSASDKALAAGRPKTVIVVPGHEANLGSGSHPWGVDSAAGLPAYKACWQRAATALRATFPTVKIDWNSSKVYRKDYTPAQMDPGTEDYISIQYYDNYKNSSGAPLPVTATTWNNTVNGYSGTGGSQSGIGSWYTYAQSKGKKFGVAEWGIWDTSSVTQAQADDPNYIQFMFSWFKAHASGISYDVYQNNNTSTTDGHQLWPKALWPNASDAYARIWNAG
jgi:hypothetical protein